MTTTFGEIAGQYHEVRPGYPPELTADILAQCLGCSRPSTPLLVRWYRDDERMRKITQAQ